MAVHFSLEFTAPFGVGDVVYTYYPPSHQGDVGGPASHQILQAVILSMRLRLDLGPDNTCLLTEHLADQSIHAKQVVYTLEPLSIQALSAFDVVWSTDPDRAPTLFIQPEQLVAYLQANEPLGR
ncbi:hypothetical protein [Spirosoma gilvum]